MIDPPAAAHRDPAGVEPALTTPRFLEDHPLYLSHLSEDPPPFPTAVNIELTTRCNLRCVMCPLTAGEPRTTPNRTMDEEIFQRLLRDVLPHVCRVDVVGDGEVLLARKLLFRLLEAAAAHRVLVNICSNGVLLDQQTSRRLIQSGLADLNVSLDAAEPETYRAIRGADWERVVGNLRTLARLKNELGSDRPRLHLSMVGMRRNIEQFPALVRLAAELGAESVTLQAMGEFAAVADQSVYLRDPELGRTCYEEGRRLGEEHGIRVLLWPPGQFDATGGGGDERPPRGETSRPRKVCEFPWDVPYFTTTGDVLSCCAMPPLGNIREADFQSIWTGPAYRRLRREIFSPNPPLPCEHCPGRGWRPPTPPRPLLIPGEGDRQLGIGWFELENQRGTAYRWSRQRATLFLFNSAASVLALRLGADPGRPRPPGGTLLVQDQTIARFQLPDHELREYYFALPPLSGDLVKITLELDHCWIPRETIPGNEDPRPLGLKLAGARLLGRRHTVRFQNGPQLLGYALSAPAARAGSELLLDLFWQLVPPPPPGAWVIVHLQHAGTLGAGIPFSAASRLPGRLRRAFEQDHPFPAEASPERAAGPAPGAPPATDAPVLRDHTRIQVPASLHPGPYRLAVGLLLPEQGRRRLPILEADGPVHRDLALLATITIESREP
jgi:MoaA/NifB/PqqE/SkfB family radical SAM enzyme